MMNQATIQNGATRIVYRMGLANDLKDDMAIIVLTVNLKYHRQEARRKTPEITRARVLA
jgi:hypothetical protein